ncbi:unnamed protein product [Onchocerca flexuosa]|uniref:Ovule protein n=1 Tax=Onchocerca flexuosa TaxID=387005 RepID=A0A183HUX1_9BILA|nr:unnamed protein product [Onchocerca flexuosa]
MEPSSSHIQPTRSICYPEFISRSPTRIPVVQYFEEASQIRHHHHHHPISCYHYPIECFNQELLYHRWLPSKNQTYPYAEQVSILSLF